MKAQNRKTVALALFLALASAPFCLAHAETAARDTVLNIAGDSPEREKIISERREATFKDVKAINVIVCMNDQGGDPDWFTMDALAQDAMDYIRSGAHAITYAPGAKHEPQRQRCTYGPFLDEPGNLNFIVVATINSVMVAPHQPPVTIASISHIIYRPDHSGSASGFLRWPFILDLSAVGARKGFDTFFKNDWTIGSGAEIEYDKPLGEK